MWRGGLTEHQRQELARLEELHRVPSAWERGQLAALKVCATANEDAQRVQSLQSRWANAS